METAASAPTTARLGSARLVGVVVLGLLALLLIAAGAAGVWARTSSSDHGWITSGTHRYAASGRAIVSGSLDADGIPDWLVAKLRVSAASDDNRPIFVGVARRADVDRYLAGVARSTVEDVNFGPFDVAYSSTRGTAVPARPAAQRFWTESKIGTGSQAVTWKIRNGTWRVVVMNADGSPGVVADAKVGATIRGALAITITALALGVLLAIAATGLAASGRRRR